MDMKLLCEGTAKERTGDLTLEAYASIASRTRRREAFYRALTVNFVCAVVFAAVFAYAAAQTLKNGGALPCGLPFEEPATVRLMLERFFILSCAPAVCFVSAHTRFCRAVCTVCPCVCGGLCGSAICRATASFTLPAAVTAAVFVIFSLAVSVYSAVCVGFRVCRIRYGVTAEDKDALFALLMTALFVLLVSCAAALLIPDFISLFTG
jgi:hypothetical protein